MSSPGIGSERKTWDASSSQSVLLADLRAEIAAMRDEGCVISKRQPEKDFHRRTTRAGTTVRIYKIHIESIDTDGRTTCKRQANSFLVFVPIGPGGVALPQNQHMKTKSLRTLVHLVDIQMKPV